MPELFGVVRRRRDKVGVVVILGSEDLVVVLVSNRLETGPVSSGVGVFPDVFSVSDSISKTRGGQK